MNTTARVWPLIAKAVALVLLPLVVAGSFLWASSSGSSNLGRVQAAIVNLDEPVTINGQYSPLGRQLTAALMEANPGQNVTWVLADEAHAKAGLASGLYTASVTIPKNFSKAATSFKDADTAEQAVINVETSPVAGIADSAVGQAVANAAAAALNRQLTKGYLDQIYIGFNETGKQFVTLRDGTRELADGATKLSDGIGQASDGSAKLADGLQVLADRGGELTAGGDKLASGLKELASGLATMRDKTAPMPAQVDKLADGLGLVAGGVQQSATGADKLADGMEQWRAGAATLASSAEQQAAGAKQFDTGLKAYVGGVDQFSAGVVGVVELATQLGPALGQFRTGASGLATGAENLAAGQSQFTAGLRTYTGGVSDLADGLRDLNGGLAQLDQQAGALASNGLPCPADLASDAAACAAYQRGAKAAAGALAQGIGPLAQGADASRAGAARLAAGGPGLVDGSVQLGQGATQLSAGATQFETGVGRLLDALPADLVTQLPRLKTAQQQLAAGGQGIVGGSAKLTDASAQVAGGVRKLSNGSAPLASGVRALSDGLAKLAPGAGQAAAGARQLSDGLPALVGGIAKIADGAGAAASGSDQYVDGVGKYVGGVQQAAPGARTLSDGLAKVSTGASKLADGTDKLADGVAKGADKVPSFDASQRERLGTVVASPVSTTDLTTLANPRLPLGSVLLVLGLWLGAVATFAVTRRRSSQALLSSDSNGRLLAAELLPGVAIVALQAVVLTAVGTLYLGLGVGPALGLTAVMLVSALAFASVNHALASLFGIWGRVAAVVMMVLTLVPALTSAAPEVFGSLRVLSPLTPALDAARAVVTSNPTAGSLFVLMAWTLVGLLGSAIAVNRSRVVSPRALANAEA